MAVRSITGPTIRSVAIPTGRTDLESFLNDRGCSRFRYTPTNQLRIALTAYGLSHVYVDPAAKMLLERTHVVTGFISRHATGTSFEDNVTATLANRPVLIIRLGDNSVCFMASTENLKLAVDVQRDTDRHAVIEEEMGRDVQTPVPVTLDTIEGTNLLSTGDGEEAVDAWLPNHRGPNMPADKGLATRHRQPGLPTPRSRRRD